MERNSSSVEMAELVGALVSEIRMTIGAAQRGALSLEYLSSAALAAVETASAKGAGQKLGEHAARLRGVVTDGMLLLTELQGQVGRLFALASIRQAAEGVDVIETD